VADGYWPRAAPKSERGALEEMYTTNIQADRTSLQGDKMPAIICYKGALEYGSSQSLLKRKKLVLARPQ